jgi:excisionase family DNA binding protein
LNVGCYHAQTKGSATTAAESLDEASALTGIGRTTLRAAIKQSELKARRRGRQVLIRREDLQAYIDQLPMVT